MGDSKLNEMPTQVIGNEKMPWTDERVELLKKLWTEGHSASQIAARLGMGVTRNAVIGKVHRLNLSGRVTQPRSTEPRAPRKTREPSHPGRPVGSPIICTVRIPWRLSVFARSVAPVKSSAMQPSSIYQIAATRSTA